MEITKEDFNKLNQLDRIEFRQRFQFIEHKINILLLCSLIFIVTGWIFLGTIFFLVFLFRIKKSGKQLRELENEYFNIQKVKRNERGNN